MAGRIKDPRLLARLTQGLLTVSVVLPLTADASGSDTGPLGQAAFLLSAPLLLTTAVFFISWFARCRDNAQLLAPGSQRHARGWAIGAWFVPFVMWVLPYRMARDIWRANGPARGEWLLHAWWAAWLAKTAGAIVGVELGLGLDGLKWFRLVAHSVAGVLAILMIQQISADQSRFATGRTAAVVTAP
ncbi:DUF4328 domain-containing protein [Kitasatospora sp. LaBMicrA B282]|uniref:DUF4328 domain-containing protein n=1 Tax=Kitasatospora sp. LaBMicrA B282 TaxID=3420949 RepID=UPI003D0A4D33